MFPFQNSWRIFMREKTGKTDYLKLKKDKNWKRAVWKKKE